VCGIPFQTKRGTNVARDLRTLLFLSFLLAGGWVVHSVYFLSYLSIPSFIYAVGVFASIIICCYGTRSRSGSCVYAFHILVAVLTMCMGLFFFVIIATFVGMDAQQYLSSGWKNWNLTLTPSQKQLACTDKMPVSNPKATNKDAGGHQRNPIVPGCDFYYNMREQQLVFFLFASIFAAFLSCFVCILGFQMFEVIGGPQADPLMEKTLGTAAGRLESLLSENVNSDVEEAWGSKQILPSEGAGQKSLQYLPPPQ
jgi:hypothetical protein